MRLGNQLIDFEGSTRLVGKAGLSSQKFPTSSSTTTAGQRIGRVGDGVLGAVGPAIGRLSRQKLENSGMAIGELTGSRRCELRIDRVGMRKHQPGCAKHPKQPRLTFGRLARSPEHPEVGRVHGLTEKQEISFWFWRLHQSIQIWLLNCKRHACVKDGLSANTNVDTFS